MPTGKKVFFGVLLVVGALAVLEAAAALLYHLAIPEEHRSVVELALELKQSNQNNALRYRPHPYFNYVSTPSFRFENNGYAPHNAIGLRKPLCCTGNKPSNLIRVVALGGSTTYGMYFSYEQSVWPALLEERLRNQRGPHVEVVNAGVPNYTTFEMIGMMAMRVPEFIPDIVLIHTGLNDAFAVGFKDEGGPDNSYFRHSFNYRPLPEWVRQPMKASYLLRLMGVRLVSQEGRVPGDMTSVIQYPVPSEEQVVQNAKASTGKYFKRNLGTLIVLCKHIGAIPVLVNMPLNPQFEHGQNVYYTAVAKAVQRNNQISKELATLNHLLHVDLYSELRDPRFFVDAAHMNKAGMEMKATTIASQITPLVMKLAGAKGPTAEKLATPDSAPRSASEHSK